MLSRNHFRDTIHAQAVVIDWCYTFYNHQRRHSAADGLSPVNYEIRESKTKPEAAQETLHDFGGTTATTIRAGPPANPEPRSAIATVHPKYDARKPARLCRLVRADRALRYRTSTTARHNDHCGIRSVMPTA